MEYYFELNNKSNTDYFFNIVNRTNIPAPEPEYTEKRIRGKDGSYYIYNNLKDIDITVLCNYITENYKVMEQARAIKSWILNAAPDSKLVFSDDTSVYYKVKHAMITDFNRQGKKKAEFKIQFTCDPYSYDNYDGDDVVTVVNEIKNKGCEAMPLYISSGPCVLKVNNNKEFKISSAGEIDVEKKIATCKVLGDFNDIKLAAGVNKISVKGSGLKMKPRWRYL